MALHGIVLVLALAQGQAAPAAAPLSSPDVLPYEFSLIRGLRELDLDSLTPIQAIVRLAEMQKEARG